VTNNKSEVVNHTAITLMPQYREKSFEQLRAEDYAARAPNGAFQLGAAAGVAATPFGAATGAPAFGVQPAAAAGGLFAAKPAFGAAATPSFGAGATTAFGAPAGGAKTFAFGQTGAAAGGAATFGGAAATTAFGGFGAKPATTFGQPAFGQPAAGATAFGAKPATFGGFGAAATPAAGAFGQPAAGGAFSFGNAAAKPFGATTPAAATPAFGFGNTAGAAKPFGTPATGGFQFGQTAAAGATPGGFGTTGGLFGTASTFGQKPATPGFGFGNTLQQAQQPLQQQVVLVPPTHPLLQIKSPLPYGPEPQSTPNPYAESAAEATAALNGLSKSSASERARLAVASSSQHYRMTPRVASRLLPRGYGTPSALAAERQHGGTDTPGVRDLAAVSELLVPRHSVKKLVIEPGDENDAEDDAAALAAIARARPATYEPSFGAPPPFRLHGGDDFPVNNNSNNNNAEDDDNNKGNDDNDDDDEHDNDNDDDVDDRDVSANTDFAKRGNLFAHEQQQLSGAAASATKAGSGPTDMDEREDDDDDDDIDDVDNNDGKLQSVASTPFKSRATSELPQLTRADYYMTPSLRELATMSDDELSHVSPFVVGHRDFGSVEWSGGVDCRRLNLDELVHFFPASVEVYPEGVQKPSVGRGLNQRARVTLRGVLPVDADGTVLSDAESLLRFRRRIDRSTSKLGARLLDYNDHTGEWRFEVEHFSRYGLVDDDEEAEAAAVPLPPLPAKAPAAGALPPTQLAAWQRKHRRVALATDEVVDADGEPLASTDRSQLQRGAVLPQQLGFDARSMQILRHGLFGSLTDGDAASGADAARLLFGFTQPHEQALDERAFGAADAHKALRAADEQTAAAADDSGARRADAAFEQPLASALVHVVPFLPPPSAVAAASSTLARAPTCRAGGLMGRSARVGWSGGAFAVVRASGRVDVMRVSIPDAVATSKVALLLDAHRRASNCLAVAGGEGGPLWQLADARAFLRDVVSPRVDGGELWRLADALWDEAAPSGGVVNDATVERQRKRALDAWLERQCSAELALLKPREPTAAGTDDWLDDVFDLLCRRRVGEAAAACVRGGELRLATLVAQAGCGPSADVRAQIELWTRQARFVQFSAPRQRIYRLLAGDVRAVCATIATTRSWRVAFALHSWYAQLERDSVAAAYSVYSASTDAGFCAHPFPDWLVRARAAAVDDDDANDVADADDDDDVFDTAYLLIRLFVQRSTLLGVVCDPRAYCRKGLDYLPAWCLHWTLATLGYPAMPRTAELSSALARQLDTDETWQWALYALLCTPAAAADGGGARRARSLEILGRHGAALLPLGGNAGGDARRSATYVFLRDEVLVPAQWLELAIAWHARSVGDVRLLPQALLLAGEWQALHDCVLREVTARAVLASSTETAGGSSPQLASLRVLLEALREHRDVLDGWTTGGAVVLEFLDCERDVAQWRRREALAGDASDAGARKRQLETLLSRLRGVAVHIRTLSLAEPSATSTLLNKTTVGVDGAPRAALALTAERRRVEADACRAELAARTTQLLLTVCALLANDDADSDQLLHVCPTLLAMPLTEDFRLQTCTQLVQ
jgi:hypothetical protein